jgi:hypothetical protein
MTDTLNYDPNALEGDQYCSPACTIDGVCQNGICFCKSPYGGDYCQTDLGVTTRIDIMLLIVLIIVGFFLGFVLVFVIRFIWDCLFFKEKEQPEEEEDAWVA